MPDSSHFRRKEKSIGNQPVFENDGYCICCDLPAKFVALGNWWRSQYVCSKCGSVPRERALMYCIDKFYPNWRNLVIHESSPANRGASVRLKNECPGYLASHYYPDAIPGAMKHGYRCENLEELTFEDESIDLHVTQDVFEHIFHPDKAFREIARTLKAGGAHIFTTPLVNKDRPSRIRSRLREDGSIEHLAPPEYHSNPISKEGSLVTVHWGYDITRYINRACGLFTEMVYIDALDLGIRAEYVEVLITRKETSHRN